MDTSACLEANAWFRRAVCDGALHGLFSELTFQAYRAYHAFRANRAFRATNGVHFPMFEVVSSAQDNFGLFILLYFYFIFLGSAFCVYKSLATKTSS